MFGLSYTHVLQLLCVHVLVCYCDPPVTTPMVQQEDNDQPTTPQPTASSSPRADLVQRRQFMLYMIRQNILRNMGWNTLPTVNSSVERPLNYSRYIRNLTTEHQNCYSVSCALPDTIDANMWNHPDDDSMHLFFDVDTFPAGDVTAKNATLSLFARSRTECGCPVSQSNNVRLLVEVNQFLQALRPRRPNRHNRMRRPRMQTLDVDVLQWEENTWIHFNVTEAVNDWMRRPRRRFGLEIKVERLQRISPGRRIIDFNAHHVFVQGDCSPHIDLGCPDANPLLMNNYRAPILEVYTQTPPVMDYRNKRSIEDIHQESQLKKQRLIADFYNER
ncbi:uncharacterized protein [Argopecten irradians]|uniref:uncharacterized protein n=1 Tax=Argopecten irradians TaxID=31199 RepID=UPI0037240D93